MAKNANGLGSIYYDKSTKNWKGSITLGRDEKGKLKRKTFSGKTQKIVKEKMDKFNSEFTPEQYMKVEKVLLSDFIRFWYKSYKNVVVVSTCREKASTLRSLYQEFPELDNMYLKDLTVEYIETNMFEYLQRYDHARSALVVIFNYAVKKDYLSKNPIHSIMFKKEEDVVEKKRVFTESEKERFLKEAESIYHMETLSAAEGYFYYPLFLFLFWTGLRMGERCALKWEDFNREDNTLSVNKTLTLDMNNREIIKPSTKTNRTRIIPLHKEALRVLDFLKSNPEFTGDEFIFVKKSDRTKFCPEGSPRKAIKRLCRNADLENFSFHFLRHNFASMLINNGAPVTAVRSLLGHRDTHTTLKVYSHASKDTVNDALTRI